MYHVYMHDSVLEATKEMNKALGIEEIDEAKEGVYKDNYYLRDHLQIPYVSKVLAEKNNQDAIIEFTGKFIDDHNYQLSTAGPVHTFTFADKETEFFYTLFGISGDQLIKLYHEMIDETFYGKISPFITGWVQNAPHKLLFDAILIEAIRKDYQDVVECMEYLWPLCEYPILYRNYWHTGVKEDVMLLTIERMGAKFKIKKVSNLLGLLKYDGSSVVKLMRDRLNEGYDNVYTDFIQHMRSQLNSTMRKISNLYYENYDRQATLHTKDDTFEDGTIAENEGRGTKISQIVEKTISKISTSGINLSLARMAAEGSKVDKDNLVNYLNQIYSSKNNKMEKMIESIITAYFNKNPESIEIGSSEFLNFGIALYRSIGTSKDPVYLDIRKILDIWMFDIINIRQFYQREATVISYTRAIFNYTIFMINHYN